MFDNNFAINQCLLNPGLAIHGAGSALVKYGNTFTFKVNGIFSPAITTADAPSLALAGLVTPIPSATGAGGVASITSNQLCYGGTALPVVTSLAFDNGSQPVTTASCQMFTLCADLAAQIANPVTGVPQFYWLAGAPFSKHRNAQASDVAHTPLATSVEVGYVYVKNETSAAFVPGTTALDTSSLTVSYSNNYAQIGA